jgi:hypothetical protein
MRAGASVLREKCMGKMKEIPRGMACRLDRRMFRGSASWNRARQPLDSLLTMSDGHGFRRLGAGNSNVRLCPCVLGPWSRHWHWHWPCNTHSWIEEHVPLHQWSRLFEGLGNSMSLTVFCSAPCSGDGLLELSERRYHLILSLPDGGGFGHAVCDEETPRQPKSLLPSQHSFKFQD